MVQNENAVQRRPCGWRKRQTRTMLVSRYERDGVETMTPAQWSEWIDALPRMEFISLLEMCDGE